MPERSMVIRIMSFAGFIIVCSLGCPLSCPPGSYLHSCQCRSCPNNTFTDSYNNLTKCKDCTTAADCPRSKEISVKCTKTSDAKCECRKGQYFDMGVLFCVECTKCPIGHGTSVQCSTESNTDCQPCIMGQTFSNTSQMGPCLPCSRCGAGYFVEQPCNVTSDIVCKKIKYIKHSSSTSNAPNTTTSTTVVETTQATKYRQDEELPAYTIPVVAVVIIFLICIVCGCLIWFFRRHRNKGLHQVINTEDVEDNPEAIQMEEKPAHSSRNSGLRGRHVRHPRRLEQNRRKLADTSASCEESKLLNSDLLLRDVKFPIIEELSLKLNPRGRNNWVRLAGKLNYSKEMVDYFGIVPEEATQRMLGDWQTSNTSTVEVLHRCLKAINRDDAAEILESIA